jgi:hypothetical protein
MEYVGIDLHKKESQICLLTETGEVIERRIRTESQRFAEVLGGRPRARILVEASTESEWVAGASKPWARGRGGGPELRADICPWQGAHVRWGSVVRRATLELSSPAHSWRTRIRDGLPPRALAPAHSIGTHRRYGRVHLRIADSPALADPHRPERPRCRWTPRS